MVYLFIEECYINYVRPQTLCLKAIYMQSFEIINIYMNARHGQIYRLVVVENQNQ